MNIKLFSAFFILFSLQVSAQDFEPISTFNASHQSVLKSNKKFQKELQRLLNKHERERGRLSSSIGSGLNKSIELDTSSLKKDSLGIYLETLKNRFKEKLSQTPEKLPAGRELNSSITQLEKISELRKNISSLESLDELRLKRISALNKHAMALSNELDNYKAYFQDWDKSLLDKVLTIEEVKQIQEELALAKLYKLPEGYRSQVEQIQSTKFVQEQLQNIAEELSSSGGGMQEKFNQALAEIDQRKKRFPELKNLADTPKKYNPHKEEPFLQRLDLGGNFQINRQRPVSADLALQIHYPFDPDILIGFAGSTRLYFEKKDLTDLQPQGVNGLRSFIRVKLFRSLFAQANFERNQTEVQNPTDQSINRSWVNTSLLGINNTLKLNDKLNMEISLLYDLFYDPQSSPNNGHWVSRIGFVLK